MREIKFRAWNKDANRFSKPFGLNATVLNYTDDDGLGVVKSISNEEIQQFTGLLDKNGKEIYIGDLLSEKWKVEVYQSIEGTFMVKFHNNPEGNNPKSLYKYLQGRLKAGCPEDTEIIGNIYESTPKE